MPPPIKDWSTRFNALGKLYEKGFKSVSKAPAISSTTAALLSVLFTIIYVLPFYLSPATRPSRRLTRDAPSSIRARVRSVTFSSAICFCLTIYVLHQYGNASPKEILRLLGFWPISLFDTARTVLLVAILFAGPLFEYGIVEGCWKRWIRGREAYEILSSWIGYRNFVVGPVSEELIWRSLVIPLHVLAHFSEKQIVFLTPLYFGIAHVHHLYEFRLTHPRVPVSVAIFRSLFQFTYTSLFGFFAAFVFLRTGNVLSVTLVHALCNSLGLPRFWGRVGVEAGEPIGPPDTGKNYEDGGFYDTSKGVMWTVAYYIILIAGAIGFYLQLFSLTESSHALPVVLVKA